MGQRKQHNGITRRRCEILKTQRRKGKCVDNKERSSKK